VLDPSPHTRATNYKFGGGLQYDFTPSLGMRLEAERYRINDAVGNKGDINLYTVGLVYRFGQAGRPIAPVVAMAEAPAPAPAPVAVVAAPAPVMASAPVRVAFSADALFDFNRSTLKPAGKAALDRFVAELGGARIDTLKVTGHTDRIGGHAYNLKLSASRADAVKAYLVAPGGIAANAIMATGVDGAQPVTKPGDCKGSKPTPALIACLAPDRRVEVEVTATK
jgi:OOP family OmpA-OmpF porin